MDMEDASETPYIFRRIVFYINYGNNFRSRPIISGLKYIWLRTVEDDLHPLNFGLATARRRAADRPAWRLLVDAVTSS